MGSEFTGLPLRAIKRLKACRSRGAVISDTTSRCTARVDIQNGPAISKPVFSKGRYDPKVVEPSLQQTALTLSVCNLGKRV
ncbi:hypothetical protein T06_15781 [Trichinella sp. T6]|nr:hypothetical protein T06_15781 [Trichinella sp. T6]